MFQGTFQLQFSIKIDIIGNLTTLIATYFSHIIARLGITTAHFFSSSMNFDGKNIDEMDSSNDKHSAVSFVIDLTWVIPQID